MNASSSTSVSLGLQLDHGRGLPVTTAFSVLLAFLVHRTGYDVPRKATTTGSAARRHGVDARPPPRCGRRSHHRRAVIACGRRPSRVGDRSNGHQAAAAELVVVRAGVEGREPRRVTRPPQGCRPPARPIRAASRNFTTTTRADEGDHAAARREEAVRVVRRNRGRTAERGSTGDAEGAATADDAQFRVGDPRPDARPQHGPLGLLPAAGRGSNTRRRASTRRRPVPPAARVESRRASPTPWSWARASSASNTWRPRSAARATRSSSH